MPELLRLKKERNGHLEVDKRAQREEILFISVSIYHLSIIPMSLPSIHLSYLSIYLSSVHLSYLLSMYPSSTIMSICLSM